MTDWYLANVGAGVENRAAEILESKGFTTFLPEHLRLVKMGKRKELRRMPLFPPYLFVGFSERCTWMDLHEAPFVRGVVTNAGAPMQVVASVVEQLRKAIDTGIFDEKPPARIEAGACVMFERGPFAGMVGRCKSVDGKARAQILIELLKREVAVLAEINNLTLIV